MENNRPWSRSVRWPEFGLDHYKQPDVASGPTIQLLSAEVDFSGLGSDRFTRII